MTAGSVPQPAAPAIGGVARAPLAPARQRIGRAADGILWRRNLVRRLRAALPAVAVVAVVFGRFGLSFGGLGV